MTVATVAEVVELVEVMAAAMIVVVGLMMTAAVAMIPER